MSANVEALTHVSFENAGKEFLDAGVATFGQVFARGELSAGSNLIAKIGGSTHAVQVDIKTTYDDGSVKMAVLSVDRPGVAARTMVNATLQIATGVDHGPAVDLVAALSSHDFTVDLQTDDAAMHVNVLDALKAAIDTGSATYWQVGSLATQARVMVDLPGSQRMVFDVTAFKSGELKIDAQFNNDDAMQAQGGRVSYELTGKLDGQVVVHEAINQGQYQNWHESFSTTSRDGGQGLGDADHGWLNIRHDVAHLEATGAVAHYDLSNGVSESLLAAWGAAAELKGFGDLLSSSGLQQYMPQTGGRDDIGITTASNSAWLISQDARAAAYAMGQAEAGSAIPWHLWDADNGNWLSAQDYPHLWTDGRGGTGTPGDGESGGLTQQIGTHNGWTMDSAHQPDVSYVPYLLTGERWMLDNLQAQGSWNVLNTWDEVRGSEGLVVVDSGQVRHSAWSLRQIDEAAWASPEGSVEKAYFTAASKANWAWLVEQIPTWTAAQGEAHGWVPGDYGTKGALPPWQQDYFASTAIAAAAQGNADALTFLEWQSNFLIGRFTHDAQGFEQHDGAAYLIAIADPDTGVAYQSWAQIGAQTQANGWSNGEGWSQSGGDFGQLALATLAGIAHLTGSAEAIAAYNALLAEAPPFTTASDFERNPTFAIASPVPVVTTAPAPAPVPVEPTPAPVLTHPADGGLETTPPAAGDGGNVPLVLKLGLFGFFSQSPDIVVTVDGVKTFHGAVDVASGSSEVVIGHVAADINHEILLSLPEQGQPGGVLFVSDVLMDGVSAGTGAALMGHGEAALTAHASDAVFAF